MGQVSDPYERGEDGEHDLTISGLPEDTDQPEGVLNGGPDEPGGRLDDDADAGDVADDRQGALEDDLEDAGDLDEEVAYDLDDFDDDQLDSLFDALDEAAIPYLWDGDELFVQASDEQAVDELLEKVAHPHQIAAEDDDGDGGGWLLGELFVVADRLQHDPEEHESVALLLQLANASDEADPPYGFAESEWEQLHQRVTALATILEQDKPDPDEAIEAARELRNVIRPYV